MSQCQGPEPSRIRDRMVEALEDMKALDVACLPVGETSTIADFFVVCSGTSETHCRAIAAEVARKLKEQGLTPLNPGEPGSGAWTLLDYGSVVLHVFSREARGRYALEAVWGGKGESPGAASE